MTQARTFFAGQQVVVQTYHSTRSSESSYGDRIVVGRYTKRSGSWRSDTYILSDAGNYIGVKAVPAIRPCYECNGEGKVVPEGFAETASYRVTCKRCDGSGEANVASSHVSYILNRKDKIMTQDEYAPIAQAKLDRAAAEQRRRQVQAEREANAIGDLLNFVAEQRALQNDDMELALAKYINGKSALLDASARKVIENRLSRCKVETCNAPAAGYESAKGYCYAHIQLDDAVRRGVATPAEQERAASIGIREVVGMTL